MNDTDFKGGILVAKMSPAIDQLATALSKAQAEMDHAKKNAVNPHFKSKYADLAATFNACRDPLTKNGLSVIQLSEFSEEQEGWVCRTILFHNSGQWISGSYPIKPERYTPQGMGSAYTYARRYSLMGMVGLAPDDDPADDDGEAAEGRAERAVSNKKPVQQQAARPRREDRKPTPDELQGLYGLIKSAHWSSEDAVKYIEATFKKKKGSELSYIELEQFRRYIIEHPRTGVDTNAKTATKS